MKSSELDEVDPMTGEVISGTSMATEAPKKVQAGRWTWAYREADVDSSKATQDKMPVLCLHGIGSSSYAYRNTLRMLGDDGHQAIAVDWLGHGNSDKPESGFDYSAESYITALSEAISALQIKKPFCLIVHGYILGQYGLLYALDNVDSIGKLIILNTPLSLKSKLRPELISYKAPLAFMRPQIDAVFDAANFNAAGGPYAMGAKDASAYAAPYAASPAASAAIYRIMESLDFPELLNRVDEGFVTWKVPSLVIHGGADAFLDLKGPLDWLENKRTCMKMASKIEAKLGHCPQEDYAEAIHPAMVKFLKS